ncbi:MAG: DHH family phosphoesterase [Planctomycetota bacterium]
MWDDLIELIETHHRFLLTTHINPDGDAIGSLVALGGFLEEQGKTTLKVIEHPVPPDCAFLDPEGLVRQYEPERDDPDIAACDMAVVLDVGALDRVGRLQHSLRRHAVPIACIDHHVTNNGFADANVIDAHAASTASLILDLIRATGHEPSPPVAQALFVGLATDTGWFRFPNTTAAAFGHAAALVEAGADVPGLYRRIHENHSAARMRLLGLALADLRTDCGGRLVWTTLTGAHFERTGAAPAETEGVIDTVRKVGGAEIIVLFRERPDGGTRVSLRSKDDLDVSALAARFGGGGHRQAAGIALDDPPATAIPAILAAARALLQP